MDISDIHQVHRSHVTEVGTRTQHAIRHGMPEVGWEGDPHLQLEYNHATRTWQVTDQAHNPPVVVLSYPDRGLRDLDFRSVCEQLRDARNPRGGRDLATKVAKANAEVLERKRRGRRNDMLEIGKAVDEVIRSIDA